MSKSKFEEYVEFRDACRDVANHQAMLEYLNSCLSQIVAHRDDAAHRLADAQTRADELGVTEADMEHLRMREGGGTRADRVRVAEGSVSFLMGRSVGLTS